MKTRYKRHAYFINPRGRIIPVWQQHHIDCIIFSPEIFDLTLKAVKKKFDKYGEELGEERWARDEIMKSLLKKGWIRVRFRRNGYLIFQIGKMTLDAKKHILKFLKAVRNKQILPEGVRKPGVQIFDISNPVNIFVVEENVLKAIRKLKEYQ